MNSQPFAGSIADVRKAGGTIANTKVTDQFQHKPQKPKTSEVISLKKKYSKTDEGSEEGFAFGSSDNSLSSSSTNQ